MNVYDKISRNSLENEIIESSYDTVIDEIFEVAGIIGVLITDKDGTVLYVDHHFEASYGIGADFLLGRSVFELEREGYFKPSLARMAIESETEVTKIQTLKNGHSAIVSAVPIFKEEKIAKVITFTRNINKHIEIKNLYEELNCKINKYDKAMKELSYDAIIIENFHTNNGDLQKSLRHCKI